MAIAVAVSAMAAAQAAQAATPAGPLTLTAPTSGTTQISWSGTVVPGTNGASLRCLADVNVLSDEETFKLLGVSDAFYRKYRAMLTIKIAWTPAAGNDLALTTYQEDADGNYTSILDGNGVGTDYQVTQYVDPPGTSGSTIWHASACPQANATPQDYTGTATLTVVPRGSDPTVTTGNQRYTTYTAPDGYQTTDGLTRQNAGEPTIGATRDGNVFYQAGTQITKLRFNDSSNPPVATWTDVTPAQASAVSEDSILVTDQATNRIFTSELLVACSDMSFSDDAGATWTPSTGCPIPHSPDHESLGVGPYPSGASSTNGYPDAAYYCSQNIIQAAGAFCGTSHDGGQTWGASTLVFGPGSPCGAIHGHIRVAPDGTAYVPQRQCTIGDGDGVGQGMAVTTDNGQSWHYSVVPDSTSIGLNSSDPSVAPGSDGTLYFAYQDAYGSIEVATSHDRGQTWSPSKDVGAPFGIKNSKFPEAIAGDGNRATVTFLGTKTAGDDQDETNFKGVWDLYMATTYDGGAHWQVVDATPNDPVQRGCIWMQGGSSDCRNLLDFNEITVDRQGRPVIAYTDGCTDICVKSSKIDTSGCPGSEGASAHSTPTCTYARLDGVARLTCGEGLYAAYDGQLCPGSKPKKKKGHPKHASPAPGHGGGSAGRSRIRGPVRHLGRASHHEREEADSDQWGPFVR